MPLVFALLYQPTPNFKHICGGQSWANLIIPPTGPLHACTPCLSQSAPQPSHHMPQELVHPHTTPPRTQVSVPSHVNLEPLGAGDGEWLLRLPSWGGSLWEAFRTLLSRLQWSGALTACNTNSTPHIGFSSFPASGLPPPYSCCLGTPPRPTTKALAHPWLCFQQDTLWKLF